MSSNLTRATHRLDQGKSQSAGLVRPATGADAPGSGGCSVGVSQPLGVRDTSLYPVSPAGSTTGPGHRAFLAAMTALNSGPFNASANAAISSAMRPCTVSS